MSRVLTYLRNKEWTDFSKSKSNYRKEKRSYTLIDSHAHAYVAYVVEGANSVIIVLYRNIRCCNVFSHCLLIFDITVCVQLLIMVKVAWMWMTLYHLPHYYYLYRYTPTIIYACFHYGPIPLYIYIPGYCLTRTTRRRWTNSTYTSFRKPIWRRTIDACREYATISGMCSTSRIKVASPRYYITCIHVNELADSTLPFFVMKPKV